MKLDRRQFIRLVIAGSLAASCPIDFILAAQSAPVGEVLSGEHFELCHQIRDGRSFPTPPPAARHDVAIIGGGVSGLTAAYLLRDHDFVLLEKEPHWGGNGYTASYEGQEFATGAAFTGRGDVASRLAQELDLEALPIDSPDGTIVNGEYVPDTWRSGLEHLPYRAEVVRGFKKFRDKMMGVDVKARARELDTKSLADFLVGYPAELTAWWDAYGRSNWGGAAAETSAMVGIGTMRYLAMDGAPDDRVTFAGGLGALTRQLAAALARRRSDLMWNDATIVAVAQERGRVVVTYVQGGAIKSLAAKAAVIAIPKFIARRVVAGLPAAQSQAMAQIPYAPYAVVNLIFDAPVFNRGYDTWCPGNAFTDFIVADWVIRRRPGYRPRNHILTCYTPLPQARRAELLSEDGCRRLAAQVLNDFRKLFPKTTANPVEVHLYRRGHPMMISAPRIYTEVIPAARRPLERVFFANTDSRGPVSSTDDAIAAAHHAVEDVRRLFAGGTSSEIQAIPV